MQMRVAMMRSRSFPVRKRRFAVRSPTVRRAFAFGFALKPVCTANLRVKAIRTTNLPCQRSHACSWRR